MHRLPAPSRKVRGWWGWDGPARAAQGGFLQCFLGAPPKGVGVEVRCSPPFALCSSPQSPHLHPHPPSILLDLVTVGTPQSHVWTSFSISLWSACPAGMSGMESRILEKRPQGTYFWALLLQEAPGSRPPAPVSQPVGHSEPERLSASA